eukprot:CAMPEP_0185018180 /NCGR_PEP_ID=MMETSP1103-20130426/989_1 /TAXON_ID=36769 /ORGANISM="Paraphysomonas bandaiensis, Strain Caron Lab Isolate" /LENGTH=370 /DNA_ID=CAMNT_0027547901 /DNA_START=263 /DNA_END=1375 /DNA_ORIENTATION=-
MTYKIGEGSFADVRVAISRKIKDNGKKVVIKQIKYAFVLPKYRDELAWEFNILSQLRHPGIVELYDVYKHKDDYFLVMEFLSGGELFDSLCAREYYCEEDARRVMLNITQAISYMHRHNVIHRDIKPENLILRDKSKNPMVKLVDFGFARVLREGVEPPSDLRGTALYVSPEMVKRVPYGKAVDIWSLGCNLYIMLTGVVPFETRDIDELYNMIANGSYTFPEKYWGGVSNSAKDLVSRMLTVDPSRRYTAEQVLNHPWMRNKAKHDRDITKNLEQMRIWNSARKFKVSAIAVHYAVAFQLAGARHRRAIIAAAKHAKALNEKGISWTLTADEIASAEKIVDSSPSKSKTSVKEAALLDESNLDLPCNNK